MKNDLFEKNRAKFSVRDEEKTKQMQPGDQFPDEPEERGVFRTSLKYLVIIAACIMIPFFVSTNSLMPDWMQDIVAGIKDGSESVEVNAIPTVPKPIEIIDNERLTAEINARVEKELQAVGLSNTINNEVQAALNEAFKNERLTKVQREQANEAVEKARELVKTKVKVLDNGTKIFYNGEVIELDQLEKNIEGIVVQSLQGLDGISALSSLSSLKSLEAFSRTGSTNSTNSTKLDMSLIDYLSLMKENGYSKKFESFELKSFYENGISVDVIKNWDENGWLDQFEFWELTSFYKNNISKEQLDPWVSNTKSFDFEAHEIVSFIKNGVTIKDINELNKVGLLDDLEFWEISSLKSNKIKISELLKWKKAGYLGRFEGHEVASLINNKVPISFLDELEKKGLLEDLEFWEISNLFKSK